MMYVVMYNVTLESFISHICWTLS